MMHTSLPTRTDATVESIELEGLGLESLAGKPVLTAVDYSFSAPGVYQLIGNPGDCSELLKALALLHPKVTGKILINQEDVLQYSFEEFAPWRKKMAYAFDFGGLLNNKSLLENLVLPLVYHQRATLEEAEKRAMSFLKMFDLSEFAPLRPAMTPGFVRKLACVIRCLICEPEILLLDGPTTAVDQMRAEILLRYIHEQYKTGKIRLIIFSSSYENAFSLWSPQVCAIASLQSTPKVEEVAS